MRLNGDAIHSGMRNVEGKTFKTTPRYSINVSRYIRDGVLEDIIAEAP